MSGDDFVAQSLQQLVEMRAARPCKFCRRPNPVCDADYCEERLRRSCPECRGGGIFHANNCPKRGKGTRDGTRKGS